MLQSFDSSNNALDTTNKSNTPTPKVSQPIDTFYCPICIKLTPHNFYKLSDYKIECKGCGDLKTYMINKTQAGYIVKIFPSEYLGNVKNLKCVTCEDEPMKYTSVCFNNCGLFHNKFEDIVINGYVDMGRPMCEMCHLNICSSMGHKSCEHGYRLSKL